MSTFVPRISSVLLVFCCLLFGQDPKSQNPSPPAEPQTGAPAQPAPSAQPGTNPSPQQEPAPPPAAEQPEKPSREKAEAKPAAPRSRSEEHTSELQSRFDLVCRLLLEKKK